MNLDISGIIEEKITEMEADGSVREFIRKNIEESVKDAIKSALGGYKIRRAIEESFEQNFPEIVKDIGLSAYNSFIAETIRKTCIAKMEDDAQEKITKVIEQAVLLKRDEVYLSEILKEYRKEVNYNDDEEEKRDLNEKEGGYTCAVRSRHSTIMPSDWIYYSLWFNKEGFKDQSGYDEYDIVVIFSGLWEKKDERKVRINEIYFAGEKISKQFVNHMPSSFESLLMNLYMNKTPIILDIENYDAEDHYYEVEEY